MTQAIDKPDISSHGSKSDEASEGTKSVSKTNASPVPDFSEEAPELPTESPQLEQILQE